MNRQDVPRWQQVLAVFVGAIIAANLAFYRVVGAQGELFNPAKRSGYETGSGIGMGIGITFVLWLLILRKAPRKVSVIAFVIISAVGALAVHYAGLRR